MRKKRIVRVVALAATLATVLAFAPSAQARYLDQRTRSACVERPAQDLRGTTGPTRSRARAATS